MKTLSLLLVAVALVSPAAAYDGPNTLRDTVERENHLPSSRGPRATPGAALKFVPRLPAASHTLCADLQDLALAYCETVIEQTPGSHVPGCVVSHDTLRFCELAIREKKVSLNEILDVDLTGTRVSRKGTWYDGFIKTRTDVRSVSVYYTAPQPIGYWP